MGLSHGHVEVHSSSQPRGSLALSSHCPPCASPCGRHSVTVARCVGVPRARVPLLLACRWVSPGWVPSSACGTLLAVCPPCSVVCPGFVLLNLLPPNSPRISRPVHAYTLRCLILLIVLRTFSAFPACCIHSCTEAKTSVWSAISWSFYRLPLLAVLACLFSGPPGCRLFTTHPCSFIGAHAAMVCVVVTQADLHFHLSSCPSLVPLPVTPLSHPSIHPATVTKPPCLSWCMRCGS